MGNVESWRAWEGRVVDGKFPLRQYLGGSDHSAVFQTERPGQPPQKAAIKLIAAEPDAATQLSRWRAAAQLSHPNLIRIFETGRFSMSGTPVLYLVMECAEEDLSQILPHRSLAPAEVTDLLPPLLDALSYLHDKGLVHRRIKPSNILAVGDLLKLSSDQIASPSESSAAGKRHDVYDAPETAAGIVSSAGDLWSVGATVVATLTQNAPFADAVSESERGVAATIPEPFRGIARECLHLDPKRRCSIAEIQARLHPAARSVPAKPEAPPPPPRPINRKALIVGALVVAVVVGLIAFYPRGKKSPAQPAPSVDQPAPQSTPAPTPAPPVRKPAEPPKRAADSRGDVVHQVLPDIPRSALNTINGTIKIAARVEVDASGRVTSAKLTSPGPSKYFANLVLRAAEHWEFSPPEVNGQAAASAWLLRFRLKRSGTQVSPERVKH